MQVLKPPIFFPRPRGRPGSVDIASADSARRVRRPISGLARRSLARSVDSGSAYRAVRSFVVCDQHANRKAAGLDVVCVTQ